LRDLYKGLVLLEILFDTGAKSLVLGALHPASLLIAAVVIAVKELADERGAVLPSAHVFHPHAFPDPFLAPRVPATLAPHPRPSLSESVSL
jgi:hypothetical protein